MIMSKSESAEFYKVLFNSSLQLFVLLFQDGEALMRNFNSQEGVFKPILRIINPNPK